MNVKIHYSRGSFAKIQKPIDIKINLESYQSIVFEQSFVIGDSGILEFFCDYPPEQVQCNLCCDDLDIYHSPMVVEILEFDNFYKLKTFAHHGTCYYDNQFLEYAKENNIQLENSQFNNCLFFTGRLSYNWTRPITKMIFQVPLFGNPR